MQHKLLKPIVELELIYDDQISCLTLELYSFSDLLWDPFPEVGSNVGLNVMPTKYRRCIIHQFGSI